MSTDPTLWTKRPKFGTAGGPVEVVLTEEGRSRAFAVGARLVRGEASRALELLWAHGGDAIYSRQVPGTVRLELTDIGRINQIAWGYLRSKGYVESFASVQGSHGGGVRLTEAGFAAVKSGEDERARLLERCKREELAMNERKFTDGARVRVAIRNPASFANGAAETMNERAGRIEAFDPSSTNGDPWMSHAYLVRFDEPVPSHWRHGSPLTAFWFAECDIEPEQAP